MNRRASCVRTFEVFEAAHVALRMLLAFSQPVNCIFGPIGMLNWLVAASKLHKHRETCCTAEWPFYSFLILCLRGDYNTKVHTPGKGNRPISIFRDKYLEELAYPGIFLGQNNVDRQCR